MQARLEEYQRMEILMEKARARRVTGLVMRTDCGRRNAVATARVDFCVPVCDLGRMCERGRVLVECAELREGWWRRGSERGG
jgi:hypothetical protein